MNDHDIRYEISRLHDLLTALPALLRSSGIGGEEAADLTAAAASLNARLRAAREEHAARKSTCASC